MRPLPRPAPARLRRPRPPRVTSVGAVVLAVATTVLVADLAGDARQARRRWGEIRPVTVAVTDLGVGDVIGRGDVTRRAHPAHLVPDGAVEGLALGRTVRSPLGPGEVLVEHRVGGGDASAPVALLSTDTRGVAVPRTGVDVPVELGDRVDLVATFDGAGPGDPTSVVAEGVPVVAVGEEGVTVAVDVERVEPVTYAVIHGTVTLALTP